MSAPRTFGAVRMRARVYLTDRHGTVLDDITRHVVGATVDLDVERAVSPLMLRGELRTAGVVEPYRDHVQPWLRLEYPNGAVVDEPVGLYAVAPPPRRQTYLRTTDQITGYDHTWRLATSSFTGTFTVAAGANVVAAVEGILASEGFVTEDSVITPSIKALTAAATWGLDQATTKLEIVNTLLAAIGYVPLHTSRQGTLMSFAWPDLASAPPDKVFTNADGEVTAEIAEDPQLEMVCNVVRVINPRDGTNPIVAVAENHDPGSPVSVENLGRVLFRDIRDAHIPDQATAESIARRALAEGATYDNRVTITTGPDPVRDPHEVYAFDLTDTSAASVLSGRWRCLGWSLGFSVREAAMTHRIGKVGPAATQGAG